MKCEYYGHWSLSRGIPDDPLTEEEAKKLHDDREMYVVVFKEGETPKFVVLMQFRTWYCTVLHLNENRRDKILEAYKEMYDMYDKTGIGIPKGIENQIFLRNRKEKYYDKEGWISFLYETSGKYTKVYHSWSGGEYQEADIKASNMLTS
ncbi:hypothetical protein [Kroppenstedtia eburnea]|uniref:Uncharacterized protein n=1 Tax=Kroppenstedtia eburnea TaxID=714067 RepID=A0A1N7Q0Q7_9BACL|nr:hypothetical protein [Kroppenstedtia eburnea]SIT16464.1 hypothetical protein SAMN05421790_11656 [Kroppenstedtia eburnea]